MHFTYRLLKTPFFMLTIKYVNTDIGLFFMITKIVMFDNPISGEIGS